MRDTDDSRTTAEAMTAGVAGLELTGRTVLVASDGGVLSQTAARIAAALERERGAIPEVLHVFDLTGYPVPPLLVEALGVADLELGDAAHEDQQREIIAHLSAAVPEAVRWPVHVTAGTPSVQIVSYAQQMRAAVIVMGLRPHGAMERIARDETTLGVLRHSATPVLAIREEVTVLPRRMVSGIDFSRASVAAARAALDIADAAGAHLTLVHIDRSSEPDADADGQTVVHEMGVTGALSHIQQYLIRTAPDSHGVTIDTAVLSGQPSEVLLSYAKTEGAELVAIASHRHSQIHRLMLGSVADDLARDAGCSLLIVPPATS
jgi:nucleotide-binding universal stress UspA family protein